MTEPSSLYRKIDSTKYEFGPDPDMEFCYELRRTDSHEDYKITDLSNTRYRVYVNYKDAVSLLLALNELLRVYDSEPDIPDFEYKDY